MPKGKRDYKREHAIRKARQEAFGKAKGVSAELVQIKRAIKSEYRRTFGRKQAAKLVAQAAGVTHKGPKRKAMTKQEFDYLNRQDNNRKAFIAKFLELELGNEHEAYSLWYSP